MVYLFAAVLAAGSLTVLGPGALAPADVGVLERVQAVRVKHGFGLTEAAGDGVVLVAVEDCTHLGTRGVILTEQRGYDCLVVDCQQQKHEPLSARGLVADVNLADLGHQTAIIVLPP